MHIQNSAPQFVSTILILFLALFSGCASPHQKAWDRYETGMLLVFKGYDPSKDNEDKVEKNYLKALEYNPMIPGVNASLGTYKAKKGDAQAATLYLEKEASLHLDAAKSVKLILDKANRQEEKKLEGNKEEEKPVEEKVKGSQVPKQNEKTNE